ncbi:MAG: transporter substrate-binding domain-containing protein [Coriobacteriales bacterium]|nr:transporter substrate-binding domain-containing protein [Coriobacteriales bacterium]
MYASDSKHDSSPRMSRRSFIAFAGSLGSAVLLSACGPAAQSSASGDGSAASAADAAASTFAADGTLRIGMEAAYAPYNWQTTEDSEFTIQIENVAGAYADGYDVQIAKTVGAALGLKPVAVKLEWDGLIEALGQGQIDLIIAGMTATPERMESISFSDPYYVGTYGLMVRKGSKYEKATSIADFKGAAVLGQKDTLLDTVIDEIEGVNHLSPVPTVPDQISNLLAGSCDAITFDVGNIASITDAHPELVGIIFEDGKGFSEEVPVNIGLSKGQTEILDKINAALVKISEEERQKIWEAAVERQPE